MPRPDPQQHYAIAVGIDTYPQLRRLRASVKDATLFCEWLTSAKGGGLREENVRLIPSPLSIPRSIWNAKPIQAEIDKALSDFGATRNTRIGERLYFYFAGHGFGKSFDDVGMLMANAGKGYMGSNIGLRAYRDYFRERALFDEVIYFIDCCRDPARHVNTGHPIFDERQRVPNAAPDTTDFVVLAAAYGEQAFQVTSENTSERRGVLTEALLKGLQGAPGAIDATGQITDASLRDYIIKHVTQSTYERNLRQKPEISQIPTRSIVFARVENIPTVQVSILVPAGMTGQLVLRHAHTGDVLEKRDAEQTSVLTPWIVTLQSNSRYEIEHSDSDLICVVDPSRAMGETYDYRIPQPQPR